MPQIEAAGRRRGERGTTLIELVVLVAIVAIGAALACGSLAARPAQARSTAAAFAALIADARTVAAITGDTALGGSGASIGVVRDGDEYVATLYAYRPIAGALHVPTAVANTPPLRTTTALEIVQTDHLIEPPFALFFSASGHASAQAHFLIGDAPLPAEPTCPVRTGIVIAFIDGVHDRAHSLSCMMAQLDLDTSSPFALK